MLAMERAGRMVKSRKVSSRSCWTLYEPWQIGLSHYFEQLAKHPVATFEDSGYY